MKIQKRTRGFSEKLTDLIKKDSETLSIEDALKVIDLYRSGFKAKFDESVDLSFRMGLDPKKSDQTIKSSCVLPHGNGKKPSILAITSSDSDLLLSLGAKYAGGEDMIEKISTNSITPGKDFSIVITTVDMVPKVSKIAKILGPKGMMPNAKLGTVSNNLQVLVKEILSGRVDLKSDKHGFVKLSVGKLGFSNEMIRENIVSIYESLKHAKPSTVKANYFLGMCLSSTMMPTSIQVKMSSFYNS